VFTLNAAIVLDGAVPTDFPWPIFGAGMLLGCLGARSALRRQAAEGAPE
jgi:hypothetical protein